VERRAAGRSARILQGGERWCGLPLAWVLWYGCIVFTLVVTGSRNWTEAGVIRQALQEQLAAHPEMTVHVGDARGADAITRAACSNLGIPFTVHYADWKKWGRAAGPMRNREMLNAANPDLVIAFPAADESRGTRDCMAAAEAKKIPVVVYGAELIPGS
jgi:YspA, cpYpsA-related SLOG family